MKRRRDLASLAGIGSVSLAGYNMLMGPTTDAGRSARDTQVAAANEHLQRVFDGLAAYQIIQDGTPVVDPSNYTPGNLASLRQEQAAARAVVEQLNDLETTAPTPRPASETVRGGVVLADHRLRVYAAARRVAVPAGVRRVAVCLDRRDGHRRRRGRSDVGGCGQRCRGGPRPVPGVGPRNCVVVLSRRGGRPRA
jgi:hypothetical protein